MPLCDWSVRVLVIAYIRVRATGASQSISSCAQVNMDIAKGKKMPRTKKEKKHSTEDDEEEFYLKLTEHFRKIDEYKLAVEHTSTTKRKKSPKEMK